MEKKSGRASLPDADYELIDLPGTYGMSPYSADERIAVEVLLGRMPGTPEPDGFDCRHPGAAVLQRCA